LSAVRWLDSVPQRLAATMKQLVAEVIGDGEMFDKATQEQAMAHSGRPKGGEASSNVAPPNLHPMKDFNRRRRLRGRSPSGCIPR
jgi:hypothetical protein